MRIFLSLLPKYQNYTSVLASIIHLRSDAGFFVNPQRISETTQEMQNHRGRSQEPGKYGKPTSFCATAPNQVWTWDITYLGAAVKGLFYYLYLIIDLFSRDIVG